MEAFANDQLAVIYAIPSISFLLLSFKGTPIHGIPFLCPYSNYAEKEPVTVLEIKISASLQTEIKLEDKT